MNSRSSWLVMVSHQMAASMPAIWVSEVTSGVIRRAGSQSMPSRIDAGV